MLCFSQSCFAQAFDNGAEQWQEIDSFLAGETLRAGDVITVNIGRVPDLSGNYTVESNGRIDFPLIGIVDTTGQSPLSLSKSLETLYGQDYLERPKITVTYFLESGLDQLGLPTPPPEGINSGVEGFAPLAFENAIAPSRNFTEVAPSQPAEITFSFDDQESYSPGANLGVVSVLADHSESGLGLGGSQWFNLGQQNEFIQFLSEGQIAGHAGCNHFFADYKEENDALDIRLVTASFTQCAEGENPKAFTDILQTTKSYILSGEILMLINQDDDVVLTLRGG